jgi:hypothetical protein
MKAMKPLFFDAGVSLAPELGRAARRYEEGWSAGAAVQEKASRRSEAGPRAGQELALQARFYSGEFGSTWLTQCGQEVRLIDPGEWNRESGPDFRRATLLVNGEERLRGDIELDWHAGGWEQHGHSTNPEFEQVVLHVFFRCGLRESFARTPTHRRVLQVQLPESVESAAGGSEGFSLDASPLEDVDEARALIELAAQYRLARKATRLATMETLHGRRQALWQAVALALGYRQNTIPLLLLAQRVGWKRAVTEEGEALLFGLAGFLEARTFDLAPEESRPYLRGLWEKWWVLRQREERLVLSPGAWKMGGQRPQNHPHRRVGALRAVAGVLDRLLRAVEQGRGEEFTRVLTSLSAEFWQHHWNLLGAPLERTMALIGEVRAEDIFLNVYVPLRAARGAEALELWAGREAGQVPRAVRETALWLCPALAAAELRRASVQQGLLQLAADFRGWQSPRDLARRYAPPVSEGRILPGEKCDHG